MIRSLLIVLSLAALTITAVPLAAVQPVSASTFGDDNDRPLQDDDDCTSNFLLFPSWYRGLDRKGSSCDIEMPTSGNDGQNIQTFIFMIVLNIIDIALRLIGYAAVGFVIYGGFKYLTSAGSADRITAGRKIIMNALIGLVISFLSVAIVNFVAGNIK